MSDCAHLGFWLPPPVGEKGTKRVKITPSNTAMPKLDLPRYHRLAKEGSWIVIGQIATVTGSLVLVRVLTEYLAPAQYGQLALGLTVAGLVNQVVMGGIINGIGRFYSIAAEKQDLGGYLHAARHLLVYATMAVVAIGLMLMASLYWLGYSQWISLAAAALMFSLLSGYNSVLSSIQNAARQRAIVAFHGGLDAWLKIGLAVGVVLWLGTSSTAVVIGYACSSLLITVSQLIFLRRTIPQQEVRTQNHQQWMGQMWAYSLPFATWGIFGWAQQSSARWALEMFTTTDNVGFYSVLSQLGYAPIQTVTALMLTFLTPILFARAGDASCSVRNENVSKLTNKLVMLGLALTGCAFIVAMLFHSYIFHLFVSLRYFSVSHYLPWIVLSGGFFSVAQIYATRMMAFMTPNKIIAASIGSSIIGIVSAYVGVYYFSLQGAMGSLLVHAISYFVWIVATGKSLSKQV